MLSLHLFTWSAVKDDKSGCNALTTCDLSQRDVQAVESLPRVVVENEEPVPQRRDGEVLARAHEQGIADRDAEPDYDPVEYGAVEDYPGNDYSGYGEAGDDSTPVAKDNTSTAAGAATGDATAVSAPAAGGATGGGAGSGGGGTGTAVGVVLALVIVIFAALAGAAVWRMRRAAAARRADYATIALADLADVEDGSVSMRLGGFEGGAATSLDGSDAHDPA